MNATALPVSSVTSISAVDVDKLQSDSLLLDVRTPMEFAEAHIAGSVLHPLSNLDLNEIRKLAVGKNACVLICRSGIARMPWNNHRPSGEGQKNPSLTK